VDFISEHSVSIQIKCEGDYFTLEEELYRVRNLYKDGHAQNVFDKTFKGGFIVVTTFPDGTVKLFMKNATNILQVQHRERFEEHVRRELVASAEYFAHDPRRLQVTQNEGKDDGIEIATVSIGNELTRIELKDIQENMTVIPPRHDLDFYARTPFNRRVLYDNGLDPSNFTPNCYPDDDRFHELEVSIAADQFFTQAAGGVDEAIAEIEYGMAVSTHHYRLQLNVGFVIGELLVVDSSNASSFGPVFDTCQADMASKLYAYRDWVSSSGRSGNQGLSHLFTGCFGPSGTVGIAYIGVLCAGAYGTGVTTRTSGTELTLMHELGHNFNAQHSFENGQGTTGGIMDYGDGRINGLIRFNSLRRTEMCDELTVASSICPYFRVAPGPSICGNRVINIGEECECADGTAECDSCINCQVISGAQCLVDAYIPGGDWGVRIHPECCSNENQFEPVSRTCGTSGKCQNGVCSDLCGVYGLEPCGVQSGSDGCRIKCQRVGDSSSCSAFYFVNMPDGSRDFFSIMTDGSTCLKGDMQGQCSSGICSEVSSTPIKTPTESPTLNPSERPTLNPTEKPTSSPSERPTKSPTERPSSSPSERPTLNPSERPTLNPTKKPTERPTSSPSERPTKSPTERPSSSPSESPTLNPSERPTLNPTEKPTSSPSERPTKSPTERPSSSPSQRPTLNPSERPTLNPTEKPTSSPTERPSSSPSEGPTSSPTETPRDVTESPTSSECEMFKGKRFVKAKRKQKWEDISFPKECKSLCARDRKCDFWTHDSRTDRCWGLKGRRAILKKSRSRFTSGWAEGCT